VLRACFDLHEAKATEAETFEIGPPCYGFLCMLTMWLTDTWIRWFLFVGTGLTLMYSV